MSQLQPWIQHFEQIGFIRWPMLVGTLLLLLQIARAVGQRSRKPSRHVTTNRHAVLAWGLLNALLGILGTALGLAVTARSVERVGHVDPDLLGPGIRVALTPAVWGCSLFALAVSAWLLLTYARSAESDMLEGAGASSEAEGA